MLVSFSCFSTDPLPDTALCFPLSFCQEREAENVQGSSDQGREECSLQSEVCCVESAPSQRVCNTNSCSCVSCSPLVTLQYVRGSDPVLKLLDDNGNIAEELSILKWNTDSVEEFLSEKLDRI